MIQIIADMISTFPPHYRAMTLLCTIAAAVSALIVAVTLGNYLRDGWAIVLVQRKIRAAIAELIDDILICLIIGVMIVTTYVMVHLSVLIITYM